jgi:hypothetical protein
MYNSIGDNEVLSGFRICEANSRGFAAGPGMIVTNLGGFGTGV